MFELPTVVLDIDPAMQYNRAILRGISKYAYMHGPWSFERHFLFYKIKRRQLSEMLSMDVDGIIVDVVGKPPIDKIPKTIPTILLPLKERVPGFPNIVDNDAAIGKIAAEHLLGRGFKEFAFCGFSDLHWSNARSVGFCKRLAEAGCQVHISTKPMSTFRTLWHTEKDNLAEWLLSLPKPVGLMSCNDDCSQFVLDACKRAELKVPYDVAIIGVDNNELICELSAPPLTSVAVNTERTGYEAAALLDRMMTGREKMGEQLIVGQPTHVKVRQSTSITASADPLVVQALLFIQQNVKKPISVNDVVEATTTSRRDLYRRFHTCLGRSVYQEIINARIDLMAQMLIETNFSIYEIALSIGEKSGKNISRYFRRIKGMTPQDFRRKYALK